MKRPWYFKKIEYTVQDKKEKEYEYDFSFLDDIDYSELRSFLSKRMMMTFGIIDYDFIDASIIKACRVDIIYDKEKSSKQTWVNHILKMDYLYHIKTRKKRYIENEDIFSIIKDEIIEYEEDDEVNKKIYLAKMIEDPIKFPMLYKLLIDGKTYEDIRSELNWGMSKVKNHIRAERLLLKKLLNEL